MIRTIISFLLIIIIILPAIIYKKRKDAIKLRCNINPYASRYKGEGFVVVDEILDEQCRKELFNKFYETAKKNKNLNEDVEVSLYTDPNFINELSELMGEKLYPVNSLDAQRCWIRYYYGGMKAQYYENYHHDKKRYGNDVKQYRLIIPIYDTSDATFTIDGFGDFQFVENMGVCLEAGNCLHKVKFKNGERLILIMDYTTADCDNKLDHYMCRGVKGYMWWLIDVIWRHISSIYYKIVNKY
jgi:hypothetical protein